MDQWWNQLIERGLHGVRLVDGDRHREFPALFSLGNQDRVDHAGSGLAIKRHARGRECHPVRLVGDLDIVGTLEPVIPGRLGGAQLAAGDRGGGVSVGESHRQVVAPGVSLGHLVDVKFDVDFDVRTIAQRADGLAKSRDTLLVLWVDEFTVRTDFSDVRPAGEQFDAVCDHLGVPGRGVW